MSIVRNTLSYIESRRGSKNPVFLLLVFIKDIFWVITYFIPFHIIKTFQAIEHHLIIFVFGFLDRYRDEVNKYYKISFCITCMNRLCHLKKTLRKNIKYNSQYPNVEFVLLDYNSADGLQSWVFKNFKKELENGTLVYYKTEKPTSFHMAKAKNIAHYLATGDIVCNLDADNFTGKDFAFYINLVMQKTLNIVGVHLGDHRYITRHIAGCGGRIFLTKDNFIKLGGYNESFIGWGHEDLEFKHRAYTMGLLAEVIPRRFLGVINHTNRLRTKNMNFSIKEAADKNMPILNSAKETNNYHVENDPIDFAEIKRIK